MSEPAIVTTVEPSLNGGDLSLAPMMTEPTTQAIQRLEMEARAMETAVKIANGLSRTQMVPDHFRQANGGEAAMYNLAAAILYGAELGLSAVQSAQNVFVVRGKPAVYSRTMAAQVRRAGYILEEEEATDKKVVWKGLRDDTWARSEWTIERAQAAGYTSNKLYQTNPTEMLRAKCIAEVCRIKYQDVLLGMAYSVEELQLMDGTTVTRPVKKVSQAKGMDRLREAATESRTEPPTPPAGPERKSNPAAPERKDMPKPQQPAKPSKPAEDDDELTQVEGVHLPGGTPQNPTPASDEQIAEIQAYYKRNKVDTKSALGDVTQMLQREKPLKSYNDLSAVEADDVLGMLNA